jgi:general secretion pathway protein H
VQVYARQLASDLGWLRAQSMRTNTVAELRVADGSHAYQLVPDGPTRSLPDTIRLQFLSAAPAESAQDAALRFFPDGSSTGGSVVVARDGRTATLAVSALSGRVREE